MSQIRSQKSEVRTQKPGSSPALRDESAPFAQGHNNHSGTASVKRLPFVLALIVAGAAVNARAQIGGMVNQSESANTRAQLNQTAESQMSGTNTVPQLYEGETSDVGPQSVVMPRAPRQTWFQAKVDEQLLYTDNVFLTSKNKIDSGLLISTAQAALTPPSFSLANGTLAPRIGYQGQWFNYFFNNDQVIRFIGTQPLFPPPARYLNDFDFSSQSVFGDTTWTHGHLSLGMGLEAMRMFLIPHYDPFYDELAPYWSARYVVPVCDKSTFSVSYLGDYRFTSMKPNSFLAVQKSNQNDRTDHGLLLSWTQVLSKQVLFQPFYEFKYTRFTEEPITVNGLGERIDHTRNDYLNTMGAGLYWFICPNCSLRGFVNYNILTSSAEQLEYREFDGGAGIDLSIKF